MGKDCKHMAWNKNDAGTDYERKNIGNRLSASAIANSGMA